MLDIIAGSFLSHFLSIVAAVLIYGFIKMIGDKIGLSPPKKLQEVATVILVLLTLAFNGWYFINSGNLSPQAQKEANVSATMRSFKCAQSLPEFTLRPSSNPSQKELNTLCECMWSKLPDGGWERRTSALIRTGKDPGWRGRGFASRFGKAMKDCGGYDL